MRSPPPSSTGPGLPGAEELVRRAQEGDRDALESLVQSLQAPLYRLSLRMLGLPDPARDATQEILILIITQLSTFRGESSISTWAYRVGTHHLLREQQRAKRMTFESLAENLGKAAAGVDTTLSGGVEERLLAEEVFLGCTQAMLLALDPQLRVAFVLGAVCELPAPDCAAILEIESAAFRKRLSRARARLDEFLAAQCGVANPANRCRCKNQINHNLAQGRLGQIGISRKNTSLEVLQAHGELAQVRQSIELYQAQPAAQPPEDFARQLRSLLAAATVLSGPTRDTP
jgi:RNA polymerase sigma factor (sigma-70 family)